MEEFLKIFEVFELYKYEENKSLIFGGEDGMKDGELQKRTTRERLRMIIESYKYELAVNLLSVINIASLTVRDQISTTDVAVVKIWIFF